MTLTLLKSKIHGAWVTGANTAYEGSLAIDPNLMESANIRPFEQIQVYNISNGQRFTTYAIRGSERGECCVNGAAARLAVPGDQIIIATYAQMEETAASSWTPTVVRVDAHNTPR